MSFHYKQLIQQGSAYDIAKTLKKKTHSPDHEDILEMLQAAMWMIDALYTKVQELETDFEAELATKMDRPVK